MMLSPQQLARIGIFYLAGSFSVMEAARLKNRNFIRCDLEG